MQSFQAIETFLGSLIAVFPRISVLFAVLPFLPQSIPQLVIRAGLALSIAVFFQPISVGWAGWTKLDNMSLLLFALKEAAIGGAIGLCLGAVWHAATSAGAVIDTVAGTANGNLLDPVTNQEQGMWAASIGVVASTLIIVFGGLQLVVASLVWSYAAFPIDQWLVPSASSALNLGIWLSSYSLSLAMMIAAPFLIVLGLLDITFGFLARNVQQFSGSPVIAPIKAMMTIVLVILGLQALADLILSQQFAIEATLRRLLGVFSQ